jgi:hypothetical protein
MSRHLNHVVAGVASILSVTATTAVEANAQGADPGQAMAAPTVDAPPTYYGAVQAALERNCVTCHSSTRVSLGGMIAPFALTTYEDARR